MPYLSHPYRLYPRGLYFVNGLCVGTHCTVPKNEKPTMEVVQLPSDHYDFIGPLVIQGKTLAEIKAAVVAFKQPNQTCEGCNKDTLSPHLDPRNVVCAECGERQRLMHEDNAVRAGKRYPDESLDAVRDRIHGTMHDLDICIF